MTALPVALVALSAALSAALCVGQAPDGALARLPVERFTLAWTHSVEKVRWEEDWRLDGDRLVLEAARVQGGGAGMEPPADAVLRDGWFVYRPHMAPLPRISLRRPEHVADYELCWDGRCRSLASIAPRGPDGITDLFACRQGGGG